MGLAAALVEEKKDAADTFRDLHTDTVAFTRNKNQLLPCDTRINLILLSQPLTALPSLRLTETSIIQQETSFDNPPVSASLALPFTPAHPLPQPHTRFRRLTQPEEVEFLKAISALTRWAAEIDNAEVTPALFTPLVDTVVPQLAGALHNITRPQIQHKETKIERQFKRLLTNLPRGHNARSQSLARLQSLNEAWRKKQRKREKSKLYYAMIKGSKIKRAVHKALNPVQSSVIQLRHTYSDPPTLESDPHKMGTMFSSCLEKLGGDPDFRVNSSTLSSFIANLPKCPQGVSTSPLPLPELH